MATCREQKMKLHLDQRVNAFTIHGQQRILNMRASGWGTRFTMVVMTFFGKALCYAARVDMSVAIVAMVNRSMSTEGVTLKME